MPVTLETAETNRLRVKTQTGTVSTPPTGYGYFYDKLKEPAFVNSDGDEFILTAGTGDVVGPGSATDGNLVVFDGITGKLIKDGGAVPQGRVLIEEKTPTGTGTASFTSIPATYKKLIIEFCVRGTQAAVTVSMDMQFNGDSTAGNYRQIYTTAYGTWTVGGSAGANAQLTDGILAGSAIANEFTMGKVEIIQYANTNFTKNSTAIVNRRYDNSSLFLMTTDVAHLWISTSAINRVDLILSAGNYDTNSVIRLYGED